MVTISHDTQLAIKALSILIDGRDTTADRAAILVTLETCISIALLATSPSPDVAARMLNEGIVPRVEERLAGYANKVVF